MKLRLSIKIILWIALCSSVAILLNYFNKLQKSPEYNLERSFEDDKWTKDSDTIINEEREIKISINELKKEDWILEQMEDGNITESTLIEQTFFKAKKITKKNPNLNPCKSEVCILRLHIYFKEKLFKTIDFIGLSYGTEIIPIPDFFGMEKLTKKCINQENFSKLILSPTTLLADGKTELLSINYGIFTEEIVNYRKANNLIKPQIKICDKSQIEIANSLRKMQKQPSLREDSKNLKEQYNIII